MTFFLKGLQEAYGVEDQIQSLLERAERDCEPFFREISGTVECNQFKVLRCFQKNGVADFHLNGSTGYGYGDSGRDVLERIFADVFRAEKAITRLQIVSGTHAIALGMLGNLKQGDELVSATGRPYDTLLKVIGEGGEEGSLAGYGVNYKEVPLRPDGKIDLDKLRESITFRTRMVFFQRSRGYCWRPSFSVRDLSEAISAVKSLRPEIICFVDNCYGEFVELSEPCEAGADLVAGSLIKNPGGGLALTGGYLAGKREYIERAAARLTAPGIGMDVGASLNFNRSAFQGLFLAPLVVGEALKGAVLAARFFQLLGYKVLPAYDEQRTDIIQAVCLDDKELMKAFARGIQKASPLDSHVSPEPAPLPGYEHEIIMAGGTFVQGSSIELSADGPAQPPYNIYLQGGLSLGHVKIGLALAAQEMEKARKHHKEAN
ncbi:MAG: methionine gamma-lyase family protein [Peptococcaceae bacterium]|jgi:cystathionine beta-lyase family protein involved in aluminum resistance|nr:methionine gamma-lyase family protein [Peptococcaceae bacterium]MDH7525441.1 methionine gamma-lyase family protein [Peptococcaceae bacterium]